MNGARTLLTALLIGALATACGSASSPSSDTTPTRTTSPPASSSASAPSPSPTPSYVGGELASCFIEQTAAAVKPVQLRGNGLKLPGIVFTPPADQTGPANTAGTVLVLLHQTDGGGRCGWGSFGTAAALKGFTGLAFDLCGYGDAECTVKDPDDPLGQVKAAITYARKSLGAKRVVLVGASMGGSQTVRAVAGGAKVDAWADISGPSTWDRVALLDLAPKISTPGLVALSADSDGTDEATAAEALADATGATWIPAEGGHGYELLTDTDGSLLPVGQRVLDLAAG